MGRKSHSWTAGEMAQPVHSSLQEERFDLACVPLLTAPSICHCQTPIVIWTIVLPNPEQFVQTVLTQVNAEYRLLNDGLQANGESVAQLLYEALKGSPATGRVRAAEKNSKEAGMPIMKV